MSENSSRSDSNIFNLSSNNSQQFQESVFQFQQFKNKVRNLLQTDTENLDELYFLIQQKTRNNFFGRQFKDFDHMLQELKQIKSNNRNIAKFVSLLSQKINKNSQRHSVKNERPQNMQLRYKAQKHQEDHQIETNPTEWSRQYYNYKYKPSSQAFQHRNKEIKQKQDTMTTISNNPSNSYQEYQHRNRLYEEKIRNMLNQVSLIKGHLTSTSDQTISPINTKNYPVKPTTSYNINSQYKNITQKQKGGQINSFNQKQNVSYNHREPDLEVETQFNVVNNTVTNSLTQNYNQPMAIQSSNNQTKLLPEIHKQSIQTENFLKKVNDRNSTLMNYAKSVSQKLQELKAQTYLIQKQKKKAQVNNQSNNQDNLTTFKALQEQKYQQQNNSDSFQKSVEGRQSQQNTQIDQLGQDQLTRKNQFVKKKSILDGMKNVQSKVLISESLIQSQNKAKAQRNFSFQKKLKHETQPEEQANSKVSSQSSAKKVIISYLTMQEQPNKWNQQSSNGFRSIPHQNIQRMSNSSSFAGISQTQKSQKSNSQFFYQNQPQGIPIYHNTSIMSPNHRISESVSKMNNDSRANLPSFYNRNTSQIVNNSSHNSQIIINPNANAINLRSSQKLNPTVIRGSLEKIKTSQIIQQNTRPFQSRVSEINDSFFNPTKYLGIQSNNMRNSQTNIQKQLNSSRQRSSFIQFMPPFTANQTTIRPRKISQNVSSLQHNHSSINLNNVSNRFSTQLTQNRSNLLATNNNSSLNHSPSLNNVMYVRQSQNRSFMGAPPRSSYNIVNAKNAGQKSIQLGKNKRQSQISFGVMSSVQPFKQMHNSVRSSSRLSQDSQQSKKSKSKGLQIYSTQK